MVSGQLLLEEGQQREFILCRNPFCGNSLFCSSNSYVLITEPLNGSTYFFPNVSPKLNFTLFNSVAPSCYYRIDGNSWNEIACVNGMNSFGPVTMPEGYPVTVTLNITDVCGNLINQTQFSVVYRSGWGTLQEEEDMLILLACALAVLVWLFFQGIYGKRRRK